MLWSLNPRRDTTGSQGRNPDWKTLTHSQSRRDGGLLLWQVSGPALGRESSAPGAVVWCGVSVVRRVRCGRIYTLLV